MRKNPHRINLHRTETFFFEEKLQGKKCHCICYKTETAEQFTKNCSAFLIVTDLVSVVLNVFDEFAVPRESVYFPHMHRISSLCSHRYLHSRASSCKTVCGKAKSCSDKASYNNKYYNLVESRRRTYNCNI